MHGTDGAIAKAMRAAGLGLLILFLVPAPSASNIFGHDDRRDIRPEDGMSGVGTIVCEGTTRRPVGALIADPGRHVTPRFDVIVTVAHAFVGPGGGFLTDCAFHPGADAARAARITFLKTGAVKLYRNWHNDWAVAVLDRRLPESLDRLVPLVLDETEATRLRAEGATFLLAGHNGERGPLQVSDRCGPMPKRFSDLNGFDLRVFNHDCDMMPGWSGGPLVLREGGVSYLIAVNSTQLNAITHISGRPYNGRMNPNTAVRVDGAFRDVIEEVLRSGAPGTSVTCLVASAGEGPGLPC
ncbi:MAG: trypsin-like peptidase domain-containing protein [Parvibaculum sp.]|nr:trypsin-like peptidase domain-containing protein [Parvibaculum sp.]